ncbi:hypothetical protein EDD27_2392 [Nonomuraea polychroma]|uniref:Uncharacterized protein n=1 Tax=Nonomuraea polychroma TaxID=46176 RepID=A0A438M2I7_9ACTN|nr:hypothetical protein EDD27_2392 [Nonomuraea polychroma]
MRDDSHDGGHAFRTTLGARFQPEESIPSSGVAVRKCVAAMGAKGTATVDWDFG